MNEQTRENLLQRGLSLCPLDGENATISKLLSPYFSEYAFVAYKVEALVQNIMYIAEDAKEDDIFNDDERSRLPLVTAIYNDFSDDDFLKVKEFEAADSHGQGAVQLFVGSRFKEMRLEILVDFIDISYDCKDLNEIACAKMTSDSIIEVWTPAATELIELLIKMLHKRTSTPILTLAQEYPITDDIKLAIHIIQLKNQLEIIRMNIFNIQFYDTTKGFSTYNHLEINAYMNQAFEYMKHFNNTLLDFMIDIWHESSREQSNVNIDIIHFDGIEGNITIANALLGVFTDKPEHPRFQLNSTDYSVQRNIGIAIGYSLQAIQQATNELSKL